MAENERQDAPEQPNAPTPESLAQEAFRLFRDHFRQVADELAEFNRKRAEVQGRIQRGARRTDGRIV